MKRLTINDLIQLRDKFVNLKGEVLPEDVTPEMIFPIGAGPWPNEHRDAICMSCAACGCFVGISSKGLALHRQNPGRFIFCGPCFIELHRLMTVRVGGPADA